jgi:hypothetical protein
LVNIELFVVEEGGGHEREEERGLGRDRKGGSEREEERSGLIEDEFE